MTDFFRISNGYSSMWLIICYLFGAYVRKFGINLSGRKKWMLIICNSILTVVIALYIKGHSSEMLRGIFTGYNGLLPFQYISPMITINSLLMVSLFSEMKMPYLEKFEHMIQMVSESTFGVYVFHVHPILFDNYMDNAFEGIVGLGAIKTGIFTIGIILAVFISFSLLEILRANVTKRVRVLFSACR